MHGGRRPREIRAARLCRTAGKQTSQQAGHRNGEDRMSAIEIGAGTDVGSATSGADAISQRLEALPASSLIWKLVILLSFGGCFEIYDLFFTGYIAPGLIRSKLLTATTQT